MPPLTGRSPHPEVSMSRRTRSLLALLGGAALVAGVLTGCASGGSSTPTPAPTSTGAEQTEIAAAWLDGGAMVGLLLESSSTCRPFADDVTVEDGVLHVSIMEPEDACTRDRTPQGVVVGVPAGVDSAQDLRVEVEGPGFSGEVDLPGVAGLTPGGGIDTAQPSAGWAGSDVFALLTWGSSSCPPEVESAVASGAGEIVVTFVAPAADQICTADMAPRVTAVEVPGVPAGVVYEAVLSGGSLDARIPIAGQP